MTLELITLGELSLTRAGKPLPLPASKRTQALLAYLAVTGQVYQRDQLCEMFWALPDDPRAALRWSVGELQKLFNGDGVERLVADDETLSLKAPDLSIDIHRFALQIEDPDVSAEALMEMSQSLQQSFLSGLDLTDQLRYQNWLTGRRQAIKKWRIRLLSLLARHRQLNPEQQLHWARTWEQLDGYNTDAADRLLTLLDAQGKERELVAWRNRFAERFRHAGIAWNDRGYL